MANVQLTFRVDDEASEGIHAAPLGGDLYRLEDTPIIANREDDPIHAGDVVEVEPQPDGTHRLLRVVERSPLRHFSWAVPRFFIESGEFAQFVEAVGAAGGRWEQAFGGLLWVHLPPESSFDPEAELARRVAAAAGLA